MIWLLTLPFYAISLAIAGRIGYHWRELSDKWHKLASAVEALQKRQDKIAPEIKPKAVLLDPDDIIQRAQYEHQQIMKGLNPK